MHRVPGIASRGGTRSSSRIPCSGRAQLRSAPNKNGSAPSFRSFSGRALYHAAQQSQRLRSSIYPRTLSDVAGRFFSASPVQQDALVDQENYKLCRRRGIRNVAIIAHVDHGKTTLVDKLLMAAKRSQSQGSAEELSRLMDSGDLEIERGITIKSKVTRVDYKISEGNSMILNIVDTPGHSDFSGEVDRILSMVDGVCLVVDAVEGPMTQTKYVLSRALSAGLKPVVVLNKCDRHEALGQLDSGITEDRLNKLFHALGATSEQMDFVTCYASARSGWVVLEDPFQALEIATDGYKGQEEYSMKHLLDAIIENIPEPSVRCYDVEAPEDREEVMDPESFTQDRFSMTVVTVGADPYLGRTCTGRIVSGSIAIGENIKLLKRTQTEGAPTLPAQPVSGIFVYEGVQRVPLPDARAYAGDCITLAGVPENVACADTITSASKPVDKPIETPPLVPPTLAMDFGANNGPLAGKDGTHLTSAKIRDRLIQETDNNVTIKVEKSLTDPEKTTVYARGELQLGILIETMRREGFEMVLSPPRVLTKIDEETKREMEPFEEVIIDVDSEYTGAVVSALTGKRKGVMVEMQDNGDGKSRMIFEVSSRGLLGFSSEIASATKGSAVVNHIYLEHRPHLGPLESAQGTTKLVCSADGKATSHALNSIQARGTLFVSPGEELYSGMVLGEYNKGGLDLEVNGVRAKEVSNIRSKQAEEAVKIIPAKKMSLEELLGYMAEDEMVEVTPKAIRLRKAVLDAAERERIMRNRAKANRNKKLLQQARQTGQL